MNVEGEIQDLASQSLAHTALMMALCQNLSKVSPEFSQAIRTAFDEAANHTETIGFIIKSAPPQRFTNAVRIIEQIRVAVLGKQEKPRDIV
jgi:hypothetical protein